MDFSGDLDAFAAEQKKRIEEMLRLTEENARSVLAELLGDGVNTITAIRLNADTGKFYAVEAPTVIIEALRSAGLLEEEGGDDSATTEGKL
ncbi:TPA: hypothetical protein ACKQCJ_000311 [Stenotrophomonas maltophilia]|uniref:hypothetical protein n=1 Tax=Stenotrophomonas TaxID=40323 RepID=UPI0015C56B9B|nr:MULTISPECIES: hypothetical protein [Stenotrophomonas]MBA0352540.1 hypothetical protein [Stenotrophomonas maltophilia]MBN5108030.1 hypothetical protein [Stenotrophomonas maltophilia]MDH0550549.1 hypothetical protein [Stenotrophomonas sp. GD04006]